MICELPRARQPADFLCKGFSELPQLMRSKFSYFFGVFWPKLDGLLQSIEDFIKSIAVRKEEMLSCTLIQHTELAEQGMPCMALLKILRTKTMI